MKMRFLRFGILILLLIGVAAVGFTLYLRSHGFSARTQPSRIEAYFARHVRSLATPREARNASNPVAYSPAVLSEAMEHFADHCATCHGNDGSGQTLFGNGLFPRPPDMRQSETQNLTDGELYWVIHNGVRFTGMPAFGEDKAGVPDEDSWKLVHFIRHLPKITEEELQTMKELNPKTPADLEEEEQIRKFLAGEDTPKEKPTHHH